MPNGTILLWAEQGLGDTIQFVRYAKLVKERVGKVILDCPAALRGLFKSCAGIDEFVLPGKPVPDFDVQVPLLSLPGLLGTTLQTIPNAVPYLFADDSAIQVWRERIGAVKGLKVGIVWQGNPQYAGDRYRSIRLELFCPLTWVPGIKLFSLQKGAGVEQLAALQQDFPITDLGSHITGDFRETAAAIDNLDLVIGIDSCVCHLAGALGKPVWPFCRTITTGYG